ncbi:hypothetical protein [Pseudomonas sp. B14(2017)]|uniref:hypothetical protein n=1 Tax=Pseudomonas sp. B14(2017) TaxID=1981745 RepID=UPI001179FC1B|nr:hypothetical protein [Pseudomonas sp. B14(2017)]
MRRSLFWLGLGLSTSYCFLMWWAVGDRFATLKAMELNSIGDFLAGVFSPLAFLWLVLGFIQQGLELRISSDALKLQAQELRESVTQQTELAIATKLSLRNQEISFEPVFQVTFNGLREVHDESGACEVCSFVMLNGGAACEQVRASLMMEDGSESRFLKFPLIARGESVRVDFVDAIGGHDREELRVTYIKFNGVPGTQVFELVPTAYEDGDSWFVAVDKRVPEL